MTIQDLRDKGLILFECISGSRAYGVETKDSDTDIKGVFYLPADDFYSFGGPTQVSNETNDIVFYELGRFIDLLVKNNPNILDLLFTPEECVLHRDPIMDLVKTEVFLSKLCAQTYGQYAYTQIRKAKGLNKKILNPVEPERKDVLDFCYVVKGQSSVSIKAYLLENDLEQKSCGLSKIPHMTESYGLYVNEDLKFKGITLKDNANDVALSSIPKDLEPLAIMSFNKSGYSSYCKTYKEYWDWVNKRNDVRYKNTMSHGKNYDAKNMMHTMRLLKMAEEIALHGKVIVKRPDREYLLDVKAGKFEYEHLVNQANQMLNGLPELYEKSKLIDSPSYESAKEVLLAIRKVLYLAS